MRLRATKFPLLSRRKVTIRSTRNAPLCTRLVYAGRADLQDVSGSCWKSTTAVAGWSERRDLNSGPPVPQTGALTGLRYAPKLLDGVFLLIYDGSRREAIAGRLEINISIFSSYI